MTLEDRVAELERRTTRYRNALVMNIERRTLARL
jgi:hypothetical protein